MCLHTWEMGKADTAWCLCLNSLPVIRIELLRSWCSPIFALEKEKFIYFWKYEFKSHRRTLTTWQSFVDIHWEKSKWTTMFNQWRNSNIQNGKYEGCSIMSVYKDHETTSLRKLSLGNVPNKDERSCW